MKHLNHGVKLRTRLTILAGIAICFLIILRSDLKLNECRKEDRAKLICLSGSNYEIGYQKAKLNLHELKQWEGGSKKIFERPDGAALQLTFQFCLTEIHEHFSYLIEEWRGLAEAAEISFEDVAINMIGERTIAKIADLHISENHDINDQFEACTVFAMATSDRGPIVGNTGDSHSSPINPTVYYIEKEDDVGQFRVIRCKGAGINEKGLAIGSANAHYSGRNPIGDGPASELSKVVLRYCPDVDSAVNFIRKYRITDDGNHYAMADISGRSAVVEKGPGDLFNVRWADSTGFVFVTNTSPDSTLRARCTSDQDYIANSDNRYSNLQRLFSDSSFTFTFATAESIIFNHDSIGAICQHGDRYPGQWYTTRTRMMLPQEGRLLVAAKTSPEQQTWRPCECGWIEDTLTIVTSDVKLHRAPLPKRCRLAQNYPNPFNTRTTISYELVENAQVEITIFNLMGERMKTLINEFQSKGEHSIIWDGRDEPGQEAASGTYYYQLKANDFVLTKRMILLK